MLSAVMKKKESNTAFDDDHIYKKVRFDINLEGAQA
jgi:hypothetical protein